MQDQVLSVRDVLRIFFRHRWKIIGLFLIVFGGTALYTVLTIPIYESRATVLVKLGREQMTGLQTIAGANPPNLVFRQRLEDIHNELEIMKGIEVDEAGFQEIERLVAEGETRQRSTRAGAVRWAVADAVDVVVGVVRWPFEMVGLLSRSTPREKLLDALDRSLRTEVLEFTDVVAVSMRWTDPQVSAALVQFVVDHYLEHHSRVHQQAETKSFFDAQIEHKSQLLAEIETELETLLSDEQIANLEIQKELLLRDLSRLDQKLTDVRLDLETIRSKQRSVRSRVDRGGWIETPELAEGVSDLESLDKLYFELQSQRTTLLDAFEGESRQLRRVDDQIAGVRRQKGESVLEILSIQSRGRAEQVAGLEEEIEEKQAALATLNGRTVALARLERERGVIETAYVLYREKAEELRVTQDLNNERFSSVALVGKPLPGRRAVWPRKYLLLGCGALVGLLLGILYALVLELVDHTFQEPESVAKVLDLPVLASIPDAAQAEELRMSS